MAAEHLVLQKLQDGGRERFRDAVDLVQEQDTFLPTRFGHGFIDRRDDFAHRVFGHAERLALEGALGDIRQAEGALARMVRHGIAHQPDAHLARHLLHDGGLAHAGRADQKQRTLPLDGNEIRAVLVFGEVDLDRAGHLFFRLADIHRMPSLSPVRNSPEPILTRNAHGGTSGSST